MAEDYLATVESYRAYLESLPEPTEDSMYCVEVVYEEEVHTYALLFAMTEAQAIEQFDVSFMDAHNEPELGLPLFMRLVSPVDNDGDKSEIARIDFDNS
jgi:hypothetical protein